MTRTTNTVAALLLATLLLTAPAVAGVPAGTWTYVYDGSSAVAGADPAGFTSLDGTWSHDNGSDAWDESAIGAGLPGGATSIDGYLRLQDPGDPRDYGASDPSNRKLYFAHDIAAEGASTTILDEGVILAFRARVATGDPLDDANPDGGSGIVPWPAGGDGYENHDGNKGNIGIQQGDGGGIISFSLQTPEGREPGGLILNANDPADSSASQLVDIGDVTEWHDFLVTIQGGGTGTHVVDLVVDGSHLATLDVIAGGGNDYGISYIAMGAGSTGQSGAFDVDYFAWAPIIPEPTTAVLLSLVSVAAILSRRR